MEDDYLHRSPFTALFRDESRVRVFDVALTRGSLTADIPRIATLTNLSEEEAEKHVNILVDAGLMIRDEDGYRLIETEAADSIRDFHLLIHDTIEQIIDATEYDV